MGESISQKMSKQLIESAIGQEILEVDATPDEGYVIRILEAYRDNGLIEVKTNPSELGESMNKWQRQRVELLNRAILLLANESKQ